MVKIRFFFFLMVISASIFLFLSCDQAISVSDREETGPEKEEQLIENRATENLVVVTLDRVRWQEIFKGADSLLIHSIGYLNGSRDSIKQKFWGITDQDRREKLMPFLWTEFVNEGQIYGNRDFKNFVDITNPSLKSFPGYAEIWNGYADSTINRNKPPVNNNITVLEFLNIQDGFEDQKVAITAAAESFNELFNADDNNFKLSAGHKDLTVFNKTMRLLEKERPRIVYMSINKTDHWAHESEYDTYLDLIHQADSYIQKVWDFIQTDSFYKDKTTMLITTDHGRGIGYEWHTHGSGDVEHADEIWLAVAGPDTKPTGEQKEEVQIKANQFAQTMAAFLGFEFDSKNAVKTPIKSVMDRTE